MADGKSFWSLKIGGSKSAKKPAGDLGVAPISSQNGQATTKKTRRSTKSTSIILGIFLIVVVAGAAVYFLVPGLTGGGSPTVSSTKLASANKTHVKKGSTSTTGSTTTIPSTTTTTAIKTISLSAARVHNSYRTNGYFAFPGSWTGFAVNAGDSAFMGYTGQVIAVGDLTEGYKGDTPMNAIQFDTWTFPENKSIPTAYSMLANGTLQSPLGKTQKTLQSARKLTINGYEAADIIFRVIDGKTAIDIRVVAVINDRMGCVFFMSAEESKKNQYWPIFDQILASLNLTTHVTTLKEATTQSTQSF